MRWQWPSFAPSYVPGTFWPKVAVDAGGTVYYGYLGGPSGAARAFVRTSEDFSVARRLSPPDTDGNPHGLALDVDASGVAHAFWTEQRFGQASLPFYANSGDWVPLPVGDPVNGIFDVGPSMVLAGARIEVFEEGFGPVQRFTGSGSGAVIRSTVPDSSHSVTAHATADPAGGVVLVEERLGQQIVLQRSRINWLPEPIGTGRFHPSRSAAMTSCTS